MALSPGLAAGIGAAAPGAIQGVQGLQQNMQQSGINAGMAAINAQTPDMINQVQGLNDQSDAANPQLQDALHPFADPNHPVWDAISAGAGASSGGGAPAVATMAQGGPVPPKGPLPANFGSARGYAKGGPIPATRPSSNGHVGQGIPANAGNGIMGYGNGGPVRGAGHDTTMGQGITAASTEGQVLTMDQGGGVPDAGMPASGYQMMGVPGQGAPAMAGRAAGISAGLAPGMAMGHNLMEQFQQREARSAQQDAFDTQQKADLDAWRQSHGLPTTDEQASGGGLMAKVHEYASNVLHMFHEKSLDDNNKPNSPMEGSPNAPQPSGAVPAPAAGGAAPAPAAGAAPGGAPAAPAPAPGAGAPPAAAPPAPGAQPGAAPGAGAAPQSPGSAVAAKAGQAAQQATGDPQQAAASATSVGAAVTDPNARQGIPQQSPEASGKKALSLTSSDWEDMEQAKFKAARAAAAAGMDGTRVYQALSAMQTSHFQGQYIKNLGAAQQALASGDYAGMEKALKAANYYLPNGQDLELHKASADDATKFNVPAGTPLVTNPFYGMPGHDSANEKQMVPITPFSLQNMATAALDPRAFSSGLLEQYKAGVTAQKEINQGLGALMVGRGRKEQGDAAVGNMFTTRLKAPAVIADTNAQAAERLAHARYLQDYQKGTGGSPVKIKPSDVRAAQQDAAKAVDDSAQGPLVTAPAYITDSKGVQQPNPHGNQPVRDATKVSPLYQGMTSQERDETKSLAGQLHASNISDGMTAQEAADTAARVAADNRARARGQVPVHINPDTKKPEQNVVSYEIEGSDGQMHSAIRVWADGHYVTRWMTPNVSSGAGIDAGTSGGSSGSGGEGAGEGPTNDDEAEAALMK